MSQKVKGMIAGPINDQPAATFFDCGRDMGMARAAMLRLTAQFTTLLRPNDGGGTGVRTQANAVPVTTSSFVFPCVSTGKFEEMIAEMLRAQIQSAR